MARCPEFSFLFLQVKQLSAWSVLEWETAKKPQMYAKTNGVGDTVWGALPQKQNSIGSRKGGSAGIRCWTVLLKGPSLGEMYNPGPNCLLLLKKMALFMRMRG